MIKAYKYRLYPTKEQEVLIDKHINNARFIYNLGLETKIQAYLGSKENISYFNLCNQLKELRNNYTLWLKDVSIQSLQASLRRLDRSYLSFFKGKGFPKFKSKKGSQSVDFPQSIRVDFTKSKIILPKIREVVCIFSRQFEGKIKTCTVSKTKTGKYFVSILVDIDVKLPKKKKIKKKTTIGLDFGIKTFITTSKGTQYDNLHFLKRNLKRLRIEQRTLQRRFKKGKEQSKNWHKQRLKVALLYEKITNQRNDYLQKLSTEIINQYDTICIEDLSISNMIKNHKLAKALSEMSWWTFTDMLRYKAEWYGKNLIKIGRFEPSSKKCSNCGNINKNLKLSDREWQCQNCQTLHDRDLNAAKNIKEIGLRLQPLQAKTSH